MFSTHHLTESNIGVKFDKIVQDSGDMEQTEKYDLQNDGWTK